MQTSAHSKQNQEDRGLRAESRSLYVSASISIEHHNVAIGTIGRHDHDGMVVSEFSAPQQCPSRPNQITNNNFH